MNFFMGMVLGTFILWVAAAQISLINKLAIDRIRFRYFALRDQLAIMVVKGELKEDSWEYKHIIDSLNFHIQTVETMTIWKIVRKVAAYHMSADEGKNKMPRKIESEEVRKIMYEFLCVTRELLRRNSRAQLKVLDFLSKQHLNTEVAKVSSSVVKPKQAIERIESQMSALSASFNSSLQTA